MGSSAKLLGVCQRPEHRAQVELRPEGGKACIIVADSPHNAALPRTAGASPRTCRRSVTGPTFVALWF